jgi:sterol desaturase/sphingolipid hydroxylase (fatty acid hydroxylase superfamily)
MTNEEIFAVVFGFALLPALCIAAERLWPQLPHYKTWRIDMLPDMVWYLAQTMVSKFVAPWLVYFAVLPVFLVAGIPLSNYWSGFGPAAQLPFWLQMVLVFVVADFLSYWQHRMFHLPALWPTHAVHHSSENLDWLSSTRFHPFNEIGAQLVYVTPLIALGFSPLTFVYFAPFTASYAVFLHANVNWTYGPLRYVLASPVFHRWHHSTDAAALEKNFGGFLPCWDLLFDTFYLPKGQVPQQFGIDEPMPEGFIKQLFYPLNKSGNG